MRSERILLVDDIGSMRSVIRAFLTAAKFRHIDEATDGVNALSMLHKNDYDLVICDLDMPKMNGLILLKQIRMTKKLQHVRFIMVTANSTMKKIRASIDAGVDDYITKPFPPAKLITKVERCLEKLAEQLSTP